MTANKKLTELPAGGTISSSDPLYSVQGSSSVQVPASALKSFVLSQPIAAPFEVAGDGDFNIAQNGTVTIAPEEFTVSLGLDIDQTGFVDGTDLNDISPLDGWNAITIADWTDFHAFGLAVQETLHGTDWSTNSTIQKTGISAACLALATPSGTGPQQIVGLEATARTAAALANGDVFAISGIAQADAQARNLVGAEIDLVNNSTVASFVGINLVHNGANGTSSHDVGFTLGSDSVGSGWNYGFSWFSASMNSSGTIMGGPSAISLKNGIDFSNVTFSGAPWISSGALIGNAGDFYGMQFLAGGDFGGVASKNTLTGTSNLTTNSSGVGTILFKGGTSRNSAGFIKFYIGTTDYYVPVFSAITG